MLVITMHIRLLCDSRSFSIMGKNDYNEMNPNVAEKKREGKQVTVRIKVRNPAMKDRWIMHHTKDFAMVPLGICGG